MRRDLAVLRTPIRAATAAKAAVAAAAIGGVIAGCAPVQMGAAALVGNQRISATQLDSEVSALSKAAVAAAAIGGVIAGCAPVQMGAAALVGNQRISAAQLDSEVAALSKAYQPYAGAVQLTAAQMPKDVLSWLIRFQIREDLASRDGLTVTRGQTQQALADIYAQAQQQAAQSGVSNVSLTELAVANGLPPDLLAELGRYQAIEIAYAEQKNGGKLPTKTATVNAITQQFSQAECRTYKTDTVRVNPQFGTLNYSQDSVVAAPDTLSRAEGAASKPSSSGQAPPC